MEVGGIEIVLEAINRHINNVSACLVECTSLYYMVRNSCKYFGTLFLYNKHNSDDGQERSRRAGGIEIVLDAVNKYYSSALICAFGFYIVLFMIMVNGKEASHSLTAS